MISRADAAARRDIGMDLAADKADRDSEDWSINADKAVAAFVKLNPGRQFLGEDLREWAESTGLVDAPENGRAWGSVFRRAAIAGVIVKIGYAPSRSSNLSPKTLWRGAA